MSARIRLIRVIMKTFGTTGTHVALESDTAEPDLPVHASKQKTGIWITECMATCQMFSSVGKNVNSVKHSSVTRIDGTKPHSGAKL